MTIGADAEVSVGSTIFGAWLMRAAGVGSSSGRSSGRSTGRPANDSGGDPIGSSAASKCVSRPGGHSNGGVERSLREVVLDLRPALTLHPAVFKQATKEVTTRNSDVSRDDGVVNRAMAGYLRRTRNLFLLSRRNCSGEFRNDSDHGIKSRQRHVEGELATQIPPPTFVDFSTVPPATPPLPYSEPAEFGFGRSLRPESPHFELSFPRGLQREFEGHGDYDRHGTVPSRFFARLSPVGKWGCRAVVDAGTALS